MFTQNGGVGASEIRKFNKSLTEMGDFNKLTLRFLEVLADNKRLTYIDKIAAGYIRLYQQLNKEEKITIISSKDLDSNEKDEVLSALKQNPQN